MNEIRRNGPLFTDLYELTMAASYFEQQLVSDATFSLFVRNYPPHRNFFVAAGLEEALTELENFHFSESDISYLKNTGLFPHDFISYLKTLQFSGRVFAMPEGAIFFPQEPVLEITAPIIEAQLLETFLLNTIGFSSMIASKAARCIQAAEGRPLIDFSFRRTHGLDAGLKVARITYVSGFSATSNVLAGKIYQIPISGTMAHSYVTAFDSERDAFLAYSKTFPDNSIFLIDTFDTIQGAKNAASVAKEMKKRGKSPVGVRLDSGKMADLSRKVRKILDDEGLSDLKIFASGGFDEFKIADIISKGAEIDAFGVGTKVGVSADAPYLNIVYKMVKFKDRDVRKLSPGKISLAGEKQVFRISDEKGRYQKDTVGLRGDVVNDGEPLLEKVMENGKCLRPHPSLQKIRERFNHNISLLDETYKSLKPRTDYPVEMSPQLEELQGVL